MTEPEIKEMVKGLLGCIKHDDLYTKKLIDYDPAGSTYEYTAKKCVVDAYKYLGYDTKVLE